MGHCLAQVRLERDNGLPEDAIVNTFHFDTGTQPVDLATCADLVTRLTAFYRAIPAGGTNAMSVYMYNAIRQNDHSIKFYDMSSPKPRAPVLTQLWNFTTALPTGAGFPAEVALCLSFRGSLVSGQNPARRRGRIYFGPLNAANAQDVNSDYRPALLLMTDLARAGLALKTANGGIGGTWCVFSTANQQLVPVQTVWCDNSYDTQRRRGMEPNFRVTLP